MSVVQHDDAGIGVLGLLVTACIRGRGQQQQADRESLSAGHPWTSE
jgi:hypothetical protein